MPTAAILPVKRFEDAKERLKPDLGTGSRTALASAMFSDVLSALGHTGSLDTVVLVSSEPEVEDLVVERDLVLIQDLPEKGQSHAARSGLARAAALGYERALVVPADCPLIDPAELDELIVELLAGRFDVLIVPDRHRHGTNALLLSPTGPFEPQFGPDSLTRHIEQAERRNLHYAVREVPSVALDVDTGEDLAELVTVLHHSHGRAPRTQGVLRQIQRSRRQPPVAA